MTNVMPRFFMNHSVDRSAPAAGRGKGMAEIEWVRGSKVENDKTCRDRQTYTVKQISCRIQCNAGQLPVGRYQMAALWAIGKSNHRDVMYRTSMYMSLAYV